MPDLQSGIARQHATTNVPTAQAEQTVEELREQLTSRRFDYAGDVAVLAGNTLAGLLSIERLLGAEEGTRVADLMNASPPVVTPTADQEAVAWEMVSRGGSSAAVVDAAGEFIGLVRPHQMLGVLLTEHDEDLARLGGYLARTQSARSAAEETILRRLWHRLPWLLLGLAGAMLAAIVVGGFEEQLDKTVLLAFFLPAVVYMADAVGTQTETVLIRGLSVGVQLRDVMKRELATGLIVGVLMGAAFLPFALLVWGDGQVAVAVGLSLVASCSIATLVAMVFPWTFRRLGADPAFGSGPLATVVQDLLSITVYLLIATAIVD
jgi:magnesium transporter